MCDQGVGGRRSGEHRGQRRSCLLHPVVLGSGRCRDGQWVVEEVAPGRRNRLGQLRSRIVGLVRQQRLLGGHANAAVRGHLGHQIRGVVWGVRDPSEVLRHGHQCRRHGLGVGNGHLGFGQCTEDRGIRGAAGQGVTDALTGKLEHAEPGIGHRHGIGFRDQDRQRVRDRGLGQLGKCPGRAQGLEQPQRRIRDPQIRTLVIGSGDFGGRIGGAFGTDLEVHATALDLACLRDDLLHRFGDRHVHRQRDRVEGIAGVRTGCAYGLHSEPTADHDDDCHQREHRPGRGRTEPARTTAVTSRHRCNPLLGPQLHSRMQPHAHSEVTRRTA